MNTRRKNKMSYQLQNFDRFYVRNVTNLLSTTVLSSYNENVKQLLVTLYSESLNRYSFSGYGFHAYYPDDVDILTSVLSISCEKVYTYLCSFYNVVDDIINFEMSPKNTTERDYESEIKSITEDSPLSAVDGYSVTNPSNKNNAKSETSETVTENKFYYMLEKLRLCEKYSSFRYLIDQEVQKLIFEFVMIY